MATQEQKNNSRKNQRFNNLLSIDFLTTSPVGDLWKFLCDCGKEKILPFKVVKGGRTKSCGCAIKDRTINFYKTRETRYLDISGQKFNKLTAIRFVVLHKVRRGAIWEFKCDCGNLKNLKATYVKFGQIKSCGCESRKEHDISGKTYNKLTAIRYIKTEKKALFWLFRCSCGKEKVLRKGLVTSGATQSCGCLTSLSDEIVNLNRLKSRYTGAAKNRKIKFDLTNEQFLSLIKQSCFYCNIEPKQKIKAPYSELTTEYNGIDRIDSSKGYTINNCRPCCRVCNVMKQELSQEQFKVHIERIFKFYV